MRRDTDASEDLRHEGGGEGFGSPGTFGAGLWAEEFQRVIGEQVREVRGMGIQQTLAGAENVQGELEEEAGGAEVPFGLGARGEENPAAGIDYEAAGFRQFLEVPLAAEGEMAVEG